MIGCILALLCSTWTASAAPQSLVLEARQWRPVPDESGPVNYYSLLEDGGMSMLRARYLPPTETTTLGFQIPEHARKTAKTLQWKWRALTLPRDGDQCVKGKGDSAASVQLMWKRGLKWYGLKYVWSTKGAQGTICDRKRSFLLARDTIVLQTAEPVNAWRSETISLQDEFRRHFEDGDPEADVPGFVGIGLLTDGDQTSTESAADYADFILSY